jgi:hypothetical protein
LFLVVVGVFVFVFSGDVFARSGCCSHHSGVRSDGCGCIDGSSLSSTCAPYYTCRSYSPVSTYSPSISVPIIPSCTSNASYDKSHEACVCVILDMQNILIVA